MRLDDISVSEKDWFIVLLLAFFAGVIGLHNFYCKRTKKGVLFLCTAGLGGIGVLVDLILIVMKKYKDADGAVVCRSSIIKV